MDEFDESEGYKALDELYGRFYGQLQNDGSFSDYSEDELVDIYDRARDLDNEAVQEAVLDYWLDSRMESLPLAERKAMRILDSGEVSAALAYAERHLDQVSVILGIMRLLTKETVKDSDLKSLFLPVEPESLDDETVIRFVEFINRIDRLDWVKENIKWLSGFSEYPASMYYEVSRTALEKNDVEWGMSLVQELTMFEPYNYDYWIYLANTLYYYGHKTVEALEAVDFALAIKPGSPEATVLKAKLMIENSSDEIEVRKLLESVVVNPEATPEQVEDAYFCLAVSYGSETADAEKALDALCAAMTVGDNLRRIADVAIIIGFTPFPEKLKKLFTLPVRTMPDDEFVDWIRHLFFDERQFAGVVELLLTRFGYNKVQEASDGLMNIWIEALYRSGRIPELIALFEEYFNGEMNCNVHFPGTMLYIMARSRMTLNEGLLKLVDKLLDDLKHCSLDHDVAGRLRVMGTKQFLESIRPVIESGGRIDNDPFQP